MNDNCGFSEYAGNFLSNPNTAINTKNIPVQSGFKVVINNQNINTNSNNVNINNNILVINKFDQQKVLIRVLMKLRNQVIQILILKT